MQNEFVLKNKLFFYSVIMYTYVNTCTCIVPTCVRINALELCADDINGCQNGGGHAQLQTTPADAETLFTASRAASTGEGG